MVARALLGTSNGALLAMALNGIVGGWAWVAAAEAAMAKPHEEHTRALATHCGVEPARAQLAALAAGAEKADDRAAVPVLVKALSATPLDLRAVRDAAARAGALGAATLGDRQHRARLVAEASAFDLLLLAEAVAMPTSATLDLVLAARDLGVDVIRQLFAGLHDEDELVSAADFAKLRARLPAARPLDLFGNKIKPLAALARNNAQILRWAVEGAQPEEILLLVTAYVSAIPEMFRMVAATRTGTGWVKRLGPGQHDERVRRLAIACPDPDTKAFLEETLLGARSKLDPLDETPLPIDPAMQASPVWRLRQALASDRRDLDLGTMVSELTDGDLATIRADHATVRIVIARSTGGQLALALHRLVPPLALVVSSLERRTPELAPYSRLVPHDQVIAVLSAPELTAQAWKVFGAAPLVVLPALDANLAAIVGRNPSIVEWILAASDVADALASLGRPEVAAATARSFAGDGLSWIELIPLTLPEAARAALRRIRDAAVDPVRSQLDRRLEGKGDVENAADERASKLEDAAQEETLAGALGGLLSRGGDVASLVAVCRTRADQLAALLRDPKNRTLVERLAWRIQLSPVVLFPSVPWRVYLSTECGPAWLFATESAVAILEALRGNAELQQLVAKALDSGEAVMSSWIARVPRGAALRADDERTLRAMMAMVATDTGAQLVFEVRWDTEAGFGLDLHELDRIWSVLEKLPAAHVEQGAVTAYVERSLGQGGATYGDNVITLGVGWSKADPETLLETLLHEVGHSVDDMFGSKTDLIFGRAGWRHHTSGEFDEWASQMGGWDKVNQSDRRAIETVWRTYLASKSSILEQGIDLSRLVGPLHPALAERYRDVGVVALARQTAHGTSEKPFVHNNRMWMINHYYQQFFSLTPEAVGARPSSYALVAPAEYFAECYVAYYKDSDGTPATAAKKGGSLAPWIKQWFDEHVDTMQFNPQRIRR